MRLGGGPPISLSSIKVMHPPCKWENSGQYRGWAPYLGVAQPVEHSVWDREVVGAKPTTQTRTLKMSGYGVALAQQSPKLLVSVKLGVPAPIW